MPWRFRSSNPLPATCAPSSCIPEGEILLDAAIFIQGEKGDKGDKGDPGSDADVTAENIERALDGTPLLSITTEQLNAIFD